MGQHNDFLLIFSKMGLIGFSLLIAIIYYIFRNGFLYIKQASRMEEKSYMKAIICIVFTGLIGGYFFFFFPFIWIAAGLQTALINATRKTDLNTKAG